MRSHLLTVAFCILASMTFASSHAVAQLVEKPPAPADAPLPAFLKPGARIVYQEASSTIYGARSVLSPTADNVAWKDAEGRLWNLKDPRNSGGAGHTTLDVVAAAPTLIAFDRGLHLTLPDGRSLLTLRAAHVGKAEAGAPPYWKPPAALRAMPDGDAGAGTTVRRVKQQWEGKEVDAVSVAVETATQRGLELWDLETGLLLTSTQSTYARNPNPQAGGAENVAMIGTMRLVGVRQVAIPWAADPTPDWVKTGVKLRYEGHSTLQIVNGQPISMAARRLTEVTAVENGAAMTKVTTSIQGLPGSPPIESAANHLSGPGGMNGLWVSPRALAALKPNTVIDEDAVVGRRLVFAGVDGGAAVFVDRGATDEAVYRYDVRTGMLVGSRTTIVDQFGQRVEEYRLVGQE